MVSGDPMPVNEMVGAGGVEPPTSSVSGKRSPAELRAYTPGVMLIQACACCQQFHGRPEAVTLADLFRKTGIRSSVIFLRRVLRLRPRT